ncbi:tetratricopeptide repeat protein [uncultured Paludibaculum sp.]|uniref:tetratricopeptide repeat protein n=1 Tax=uncultured Paludibaculum sp. TaxID=1765020 RepID=UPI002AAC2362|nr:tetratricopeptide repeat protein [uncultured Paludibaculum sp.]
MRRDEIKESLIGVGVFHRDPTWDPQSDALVRVQMRNLRLRLAKYYETEGLADEITITIPRGQYVPRFTFRSDSKPAPATGLQRRQIWTASAVAAGLIAAASGLILLLRTPTPPPAIGVAPFQNLSGDVQNDYLALGLTEELTALLARSPAFRVASLPTPLTSAGEASGALRAKAREARVGFAILGSIRRTGPPDGGKWSVTVRLLDTRNGFYVWSERLTVPAPDLEGVPDSIANGIRLALSVPSGRGPISPASKPNRSPAQVEAHELYLRGLYFRSKPADGGALQARKLFEQAVSLDPQHSRAHVALGEAYLTEAFQEGSSDPQRFRAARREADLAARIDPGLPEAAVLRGRLAMIADWDAAAAEGFFRTALEAAPGNARAHQAYALFLMSRGRRDESVEQITQARDLDPITMSRANDYGVILYAARRFEEALRESGRLLEVAPESGSAHFLRASILDMLGRDGEAIAEFQAALRQQPGAKEILSRYGTALVRAGRVEEARGVLEQLTREPVLHVHLAMLLVALKETDRALAELAVSCDGHEADLLFLDAEPLFDGLRGDARFQRIRARVGLSTR